VAIAQKLRSIAFPSISTGVYGYPIELAAVVAVSSVHEVISGGAPIDDVVFCCFSAADLAVYERLLTKTSHTETDTQQR
jgi:O-acetyl-ADP-ribose deacetylase (regulator of RNase III)